MLTINPHQAWEKIEPAEADLFLYLLQGQIIIKTISETKECAAKDSVYIKLNQTVTITNDQSATAVLLLVSDPPIF